MMSAPGEPRTEEVAVVLTTVETDEQARTLARSLVECHLAACVSILPIAASVYRWEGKLAESSEFLLWMKTTTDLVAELTAAIRKEHPYSLPEILVLDAKASAEYGAWVRGETGRS